MQIINEEAVYDEKTGNIFYSVTKDITAVLQLNVDLREQGNNGFTQGRTMREIANIDPEHRNHWMKERGIPFHQLDREYRRKYLEMYLNANPQYMAVKALKTNTANQGHIFIK